MRTILEIVVIAVVAVGVGATYIGITGKQDFTSDASRYPNARVCKMAGGDKPDAPGPGVVEPAPGDTPDGGGDPVASTDAGDAGSGGADADAGSGDGGSEVASAGGSDGGSSGGEGEGDIPHMGFDEAKQAWEDGLLFVDARATKYYEKGHIPGARSIPAWEPRIDEKVAALAAEFGTSVPVIVYCNRSEECEDSHIVGAQLQGFGFTDLTVYEGGFPGWHEEKMPYVEGSEPGSIETAKTPDEEGSEG